jgi:hypothetical protein
MLKLLGWKDFIVIGTALAAIGATIQIIMHLIDQAPF